MAANLKMTEISIIRLKLLRQAPQAARVSHVKVILKMVGIGYLVEFSAGILNDFGQNSLADKLVFCGKIVVLVLMSLSFTSPPFQSESVSR